MIWLDTLFARLNERSTWAAIYSAVVAAMPTAMDLDAPWSVLLILASLLGAIVPDGKVIAP